MSKNLKRKTMREKELRLKESLRKKRLKGLPKKKFWRKLNFKEKLNKKS